MPYFAVAILAFFLSLFEFTSARNLLVVKGFSLDKLCYIYLSIFLCLIAAVRFETGADWQNYQFIFRTSLQKEAAFGVESGFFLLNKFFKKSFDSFYLQQVVINSFCAFCIFRNFYRRSDYPIFTLLLYILFSYFFTTDMAQTRQHIAMAICCLGYKFTEQKKIIPWIVIVILAMQFHVSAILAFPLYFTNRIQISSVKAFLLLFFAIFIVLFGLSLVRAIVELIMYLPFIPKRLSVILQRYFYSKTEGQFSEFSSGLGFWGRYLFYFAIATLFLLRKKVPEQKYFFLNFLIAVILQAMGRNFDQFSRVANYYLICGSGLCAYNIFPDSKSFFKKVSNLRLFFCFIFLCFTFLTFSKQFNDRYKKSFLPYKTFIFEEAS